MLICPVGLIIRIINFKINTMDTEMKCSAIFDKAQLGISDVSLSNFFDKQHELIGDMISELNKKKDAIIMQRLEKLGIEIDVETEQRRRFKNFVVEYNDTEETYWYNDGSETGLRIVTFKRAQPNFDLKEPNHTVKTEVNYY